MGRLIDADKLKAHYAWWENGTAEMTLAEAKKTFDTIIDLQPTVDAERHGHWERYNDGFGFSHKCSLCNFEIREQWITLYNYCPNCGAKMDEVEA